MTKRLRPTAIYVPFYRIGQVDNVSFDWLLREVVDAINVLLGLTLRLLDFRLPEGILSETKLS